MNALAKMASPMPNPSDIWIATAHREPPEWVVEHMTTTVIHDDGSFEVEAADGVTMVRPGYAAFIIDDKFFACPTKDVSAKVALVTGVTPVASPPRPQSHSAAPAERKAPAPKAAAVRRFNAPVGTPPAPQFAAPDQLEVDDTYQRSIEGGASQKLIEKIAINWDWRLCLPLLVSRRAGKLFVIDGQHRFEAAKMRGDIPHLPVIIFDFDDPKAEAELFVQANRARRPMQKIDDFHAACASGEPKSLQIRDVIERSGLCVARVQSWQGWKVNEVAFVGGVGKIIRDHGEDVAQTAMNAIATAYKGQILIGASPLFEAIAKFAVERVKEDRPVEPGLLVAILNGTPLPDWREAVNSDQSGYERAEAMLSAVRSAYVEAEAE